jgi:hypothetical protein
LQLGLDVLGGNTLYRGREGAMKFFGSRLSTAIFLLLSLFPSSSMAAAVGDTLPVTVRIETSDHNDHANGRFQIAQSQLLPRLTEVTPARGVRDGKPVDPGDAFKPDAGKIYVYFRIAGHKAPTKLRGAWHYLGGGGDRVITESEMTAQVTDDRGNFQLELAPGRPWPQGDYRMDIKIGEALVTSARFRVVEASSSAAPRGSASGQISIPAAQSVVDKAREAEALAGQGKHVEAMMAMDEATATLWEKSPLVFRRALWVAEPPEGFGVFNPRENNVFAAGAPMIAYAEPIGFGWRRAGEIWRVDLAIDIVVKSADGTVLLERADFQKLEIGSRVRNREFMTRVTYTFTGIAKGDYILDTTLRDKVSGKKGTFTLSFVVR